MPWLCCHRTPKSKREDQYKVTDEAEESPPMDVDEAAPATDTFSWDRRPKMDPDQYRIHDVDGATEVRRGGAGQPMAIESCKNSTLVVLDYTSTITVDDCSDCLIVLAPCAGSVFLRDCESCTVLVACQQLRTRDCRGLRLALHCATQPIIEETTNAVFHPLTLHYDKFTDDMIGARLSPFFSHSTSVHDFTPEKSELHYRLSSDVLPLNLDQISALSSHGISTNPDDSDIPFRAGKLGASQFYYAGCSDGQPRFPFVERCQKVAQAIAASPSLRLVDTNEVDMHKHGTKLGMAGKGLDKLVVFEVCGEEHDLEQLMSDGGFEKVADYKESSFAAALTSINQLMLS